MVNIFTISVSLDVKGTYEIRKYLKANGFKIRRFNPNTRRIEDYIEDYSYEDEQIEPDYEDEHKFECLFSSKACPNFEIIERLSNCEAASFTFGKTRFH